MILIAALVDDAVIACAIAAFAVLTISIWASVDSIKFKNYQTGLPGPVVLFIGLAFLWVAYFPITWRRSSPSRMARFGQRSPIEWILPLPEDPSGDLNSSAPKARF